MSKDHRKHTDRDRTQRAGNAVADRLREQFGYDLDKDEEQSRKN